MPGHRVICPAGCWTSFGSTSATSCSGIDVLPAPERLQAELEQVDASEPEGEGSHEL